MVGGASQSTREATGDTNREDMIMRSLGIGALALWVILGSVQAQEMGVMPAEEAAVDAGGVEATTVVGTVARAAFTTGIAEREPVDNLLTADTGTDRVYFFTELLDLDGQSITHRWQYQGTVMAEVSFDVRGPRWRVYSSKKLVPEWTGNWYVDVVDGSGNVLYTGELIYTAAP